MSYGQVVKESCVKECRGGLLAAAGSFTSGTYYYYEYYYYYYKRLTSRECIHKGSHPDPEAVLDGFQLSNSSTYLDYEHHS